MVLFLLTSAAQPAPPPATEGALNQKLKASDSPWNFSCNADYKYLGKKEHRSVCRGKVTISRDDLKIKCDMIETENDDKMQVKKVRCLENVVITTQDGRATAEKAEFDNETQDVILTGNPVLFQGGNVIHGELVRYNLKDESFVVSKIRATMKNETVKGQSASMPAGKSSAPASRPTQK